ncbi:hypothetical protein LBMAG52_38780 [Planctomycetia bacterium]|nr:hypothetical protein LBMAG52_38780 [Planctomycetia bacterium]
MTNPHPSTAPNSFPPESLAEKPSRLLWWLHPKVALPLTLLGLLLAAPFLYRGYRISRVPDIGDPFNVEAFGTVNIAPADNAMTQYALATTLLRKRGYSGNADLEIEEKARTQGWTFASEAVAKWLDDNQPALAEWRKGTKLSQAVAIQPKDFRFTSTLEVVLESREFSRLATLQAERCAHDGDLDAAWGWLLADVRASRHVEQNGCLIQRLVGIAIFYRATDGIKRWAAHPAVTPDLLRKALAEFHEADGLTPANSVAMKTEYLVLRNTLKNAKALQEVLGDGIDVPWGLRSPMLFVMGEPDVSLKVFEHLFANILSEIDKPIRDRAPSAGGSFQLYDLPPGSAACMPARELDNVVKSAVLAGFTLPAYQQADAAMQREAARRATVSLMLACQLHHRLHGDWPAKVEDLVPDNLAKPPADPLGKSGEQMRLKRDGDDLVIYSVGLNGADDGGNIGDSAGANPNEAPDQGARAKYPKK